MTADQKRPRNTPRARKPARRARPARKDGLRAEAAHFLDTLKKPVVPERAARFPVAKDVDSAKLHAELAAELDDIRAQAEGDPFTNPVQLLVLDISTRLHRGKLSFSAVEALIQRLTYHAFMSRAERLQRYLGSCERKANAARIRQLVRDLADRRNMVWGGAKAKGAQPGLVKFESFKNRIELELFGAVFTAHPTFGLSGELLRALAQLAADSNAEGGSLGAEEREEIFRLVATAEHRPDPDLDLDREHELSLEAIRNMQAALREVYDIIFEVADELYPGRAKELTPKLVTIASWVGYDIDGRSDILWTDTLEKRLRVQELQLIHYRDTTRGIRERCEKQGESADVRHTLDLVESRLELAINELREEVEVFASPEVRDASGYERIRRIAKSMHEGLSRRLIGSDDLIELLTHAIESCGDAKAVRRLCILRAEVGNYGLGMAHTHVRLNASQIHNAIRKAVGMETSPDDPTNRRTYLNAVDQLLAEVKPVTINFGSILAERASAKRLFMIVTQMLKYVDATTPVRFLIAETETPFTVLAALYFARLFGIDDKIDISPLFETETALDRGARVVEELLENEHYRAYVRKRGRLSIQTGFSDSGRYLGQTAAAAAIEQMRLRIGEILAQRDMDGVQLLIFDTHGESIGRGGHPASLFDRLNYVSTPAGRSLFIRQGLPFKEEISFQGGDGYVYFMNPTSAFAAVSRIMENVLETPQEKGDDAYYADPDYITEFFTSIRQFNKQVMEDRNYAALLGAFGTNMLYAAGSRSVVRQSEVNGGGGGGVTHPSQIRAIPQNSILQQLGMLANTLGGVGQAIRRDQVRFLSLYDESDRFHRLMGMVEYAFSFSDVDVLKAYIDSFDPGLWLLRAARTPSPSRSEMMRGLSERLEDFAQYEMLAKIFRVIQKDYLDIRGWRLSREDTGGMPGSRGRVLDKESRDNLLLLHSLRIALVQEMFMISTRIPEFSMQTGTTRERLIAQILNLDVGSAVKALTRIFPRFGDVRVTDDFGEPATYRSDEALSYEQEHERIFQPLSRNYDLIRRASSGIIHIIGALG